MFTLLLFLAGVLGPDGPKSSNDFVDIDFAKVERKIGKQPKYVAEPLYALFIFDRAGKSRVWVVLDKSEADLEYYDVLYFDKNGNGDLTDDGERFTGKYNPAGEPAGIALLIRVGEFKVPGTDLIHTNLEFSTVPKKDRRGIWFRMKWNGKDEVSGGYSRIGIETTVYGKSAEMAPVLRPTVEGPLSFGIYTWGPEKLTLKIGSESKVYFTVGNNGSGNDTLCGVSENFLVPGEDLIVATLIAKDDEGKEVTTRNEIKGHC